VLIERGQMRRNAVLALQDNGQATAHRIAARTIGLSGRAGRAAGDRRVTGIERVDG
jgi:hypothetical protein